MAEISLSYIDGKNIESEDALLQRYEVALFTTPGEFSPNPGFGVGIEAVVDEPLNDRTISILNSEIRAITSELFPGVEIAELRIEQTQTFTLSVILRVNLLPFASQRVIEKELSLNV